MNKLFTILLICILFSRLFVICSGIVFAGSSISKPSVPEFTLQFVDNSYDVPPTFSKDPFTGETVMAKEGYIVDNRSVEVKIKNQQFTPYTDSQGNWVMLRYDIRWKGHFDDYWHEYSSRNPWNCIASNNELVDDVHLYYPNAPFLRHPNAPYTDVPYFVGTRYDDYSAFLGDVSDGGQIDFQVKTLIGTWSVVRDPSDAFPYMSECVVFSGEDSGWSKAKTVTIGASAGGVHDHLSSDKNPFLPPTQLSGSSEGFIGGLSLTESVLLIVVIVLIVLLGVSLFYIQKRMTLEFQEGFS